MLAGLQNYDWITVGLFFAGIFMSKESSLADIANKTENEFIDIPYNLYLVNPFI